MEKSENSAMKQLSLAKITGKASEQEIVSWQEFELLMRSKKINEAIIIIMEADESIEVGIAKTLILKELIFSPDGVDCIDGYLIVDHTEKDKLLPCIIFIEPKIEYAVEKAILYGSRQSVIQCIITNNDEFHVNECKLSRPFEFYGHELN